LGVSIATNLKNAFDSISVEAMALAVYDVYYDSVKMTPQEADAFIRAYLTEIQEKEGVVNLEKGMAFLADNAEKEGVKITESGLQYMIITEGTGEVPSESSTVKVHYEGTLIDGSVFDSSYERGQPAEFGVNQVISGWTEALQLMKEGAKYKLFIPADLAYGSRGNSAIGPNQVLIFTVELLEIIE
jgi:FKBP-type peptidyl-prolyl cis-trans isomerase